MYVREYTASEITVLYVYPYITLNVHTTEASSS